MPSERNHLISLWTDIQVVLISRKKNSCRDPPGQWGHDTDFIAPVIGRGDDAHLEVVSSQKCLDSPAIHQRRRAMSKMSTSDQIVSTLTKQSPHFPKSSIIPLFVRLDQLSVRLKRWLFRDFWPHHRDAEFAAERLPLLTLGELGHNWVVIRIQHWHPVDCAIVYSDPTQKSSGFYSSFLMPTRLPPWGEIFLPISTSQAA